MTWLTGLVWRLPPVERSDLPVNDLRARREWVMLTLNTYVTVFFAVGLAWFHAVRGPVPVGVMEGAIALVFIWNLRWLRSHKNTTLTASIAATATLMGVAITIHTYGGFHSPATDLLQFIPLLAVVVWGPRVAALASTIAAALVFGFWAALPQDTAGGSAALLHTHGFGYRLITLVTILILLEMVMFERKLVRRLVRRTRGALGGDDVVKRGAPPDHAPHLATLSHLAAGVQHEINTPLTAAMGQLELAIEAHRGGKSFGTGVKDARDSLNEVALIVANLRKYSLGGRQKENRTDLKRAATAALALMDNDLRHRATVRVDLQPVPVVTGDSALWTDVFVDLLSVACNSIEPGNADQEDVLVSLQPAGDGAEIAIEYTCDTSRSSVGARSEQPGDLGIVLGQMLAASLGGTLTIGQSQDGLRERCSMWLPRVRTDDVSSASDPPR